MKVRVMGKEISVEEIPDPAPMPEMYFAAPILSPRAIDRASQIVPDEVWKATGLHTWLSGRASKAFEQIKVGEKEVRLGKLTYRFSLDHTDRPILDTVMLAN